MNRFDSNRAVSYVLDFLTRDLPAVLAFIGLLFVLGVWR